MSIPTNAEIAAMRNRAATAKDVTDCALAPHYAQDVTALLEDRQMLLDMINTPEIEDFLLGVKLEAAHQEQRWGTAHDAGKEPSDWFWLIGYLAGKALQAATQKRADRLRHHCISTAAALANWHRTASGTGRMQPGYLPASITGHNPSENV